MSAMLILKMFGGFFAKNWRAFVVAAILGTCLWIWCDWRAQSEEIATLEYELRSATNLAWQWRDISAVQSSKALEAARLRDEFEENLKAELAKPPKTIVKWKEAAAAVPDVVASAPDCEAAVRDLGKFLRDAGDGGHNE